MDCHSFLFTFVYAKCSKFFHIACSFILFVEADIFFVVAVSGLEHSHFHGVEGL